MDAEYVYGALFGGGSDPSGDQVECDGIDLSLVCSPPELLQLLSIGSLEDANNLSLLRGGGHEASIVI